MPGFQINFCCHKLAGISTLISVYHKGVYCTLVHSMVTTLPPQFSAITRVPSTIRTLSISNVQRTWGHCKSSESFCWLRYSAGILGQVIHELCSSTLWCRSLRRGNDRSRDKVNCLVTLFPRCPWSPQGVVKPYIQRCASDFTSALSHHVNGYG